MAREAGARKVYFASAAPPVRYPERLRHRHADRRRSSSRTGRTEDEIARVIGADWLVYQDLDDLDPRRAGTTTRSITAFDTSCFSGEYVTGDVTREFLARIEHERSDGLRAQRLLDLPGGRTARAV